MSTMPRYAKISILYGTETGNSADLAKIIAWTLSRLDPAIQISVMSCDDYPIQNLPEEKFMLIICSTSGLGDAPLNMKLFWRFLMRKDLPPDSLDQLEFCVIGLGDSSYAKYNYVAKKLFKRLLALGAKNLLDLVLGDEQHEFGPFYTIDPWLKQFYAALCPENIGKLALEDDGLVEPSFEVHFGNDLGGDNPPSDLPSKYDALNPLEAPVIENRRVTAPDHFQDVRLITFKIDEKMSYRVTDVCVVYPENLPEDVDHFLELMNLADDPNKMIYIERNKSGKCWIPQWSYYFHLLKIGGCSVRDLAKKYLDFNSIPKRSFFDLFYRFSHDQLERDKLKRFASGADLDELYDYVNRPKRTILEVMADFPQTTPNVPLRYLFDLIPAMAWRSYSIASSPLVQPEAITLLYAVVNYRTRLRKPRLGQCTNWMASQIPPDASSVRIFLRESNFKLPESTKPIIMISAGTGVAPFRAFIQERTYQGFGQNYLFFGCRLPDKDYYLQDEWEPLIQKKLLEVFVAFSRKNPDGDKFYVQNLVWKQRDLVFRIFTEQNGTIFVAGKSKQYPELVRETLVNIFKEKMSENSDDDQQKRFEDLVARFEAQKRIQFECW